MNPMSPRPPSSRGTGSQHALRRRNRELVIEALARRGPSTQANLARTTGLATGTISNIVRELDQENLISSRPIVDSGRRAIEIALGGSDKVSVGIDINRSCVTVALATLDRRLRRHVTVDLELGHRPEDTLLTTRRLVRELLDSEALPASAVVGYGIGLPTALGHDSNPVGPDFLLPGWHGHDLPGLAEDVLRGPVTWENDANLDALAQIAFGPFGGVSDLVFIKVGRGIGAGIVTGGQLVRGHVGAAGELGHLPIDPDGELCYCGNRGCLETLASTTRIAASLQRARRGRERELTDADVVALARSRDLATLRILDDAGQALGTAIAAVCNILNPEVVVIGGPLAPIGAPLLEPATRALARKALPAVAASTVVTANQLGETSEAMGALALVAQRSVLSVG